MTVDPRFCGQCGGALVTRVVDGRPRPTCCACGTVCYRNPLPVASAVVLNERREVLLVRRRHEPQRGMWCLPIGFAEMDETIAEAALRELHEEAGVIGRIIRLLDVESVKSDFYGDLLTVTFEVERMGGAEAAGDDAEAVAYFPLDALPELAFTSNDRALQICRDAHREEWAIRESFAQLQTAEPELLLSDALVAVIREHAEEISASWLADVCSSPSTRGYRRADPALQRANTTTALSQFGRWLKGDEAEQEVRAFYRALGAERAAEGIPLHEVLSSLMLLRKHVWSFARGQGVWERPIDAYRVLELDRRLVLFFDRAMYHVARGYGTQGDWAP